MLRGDKDEAGVKCNADSAAHQHQKREAAKSSCDGMRFCHLSARTYRLFRNNSVLLKSVLFLFALIDVYGSRKKAIEKAMWAFSRTLGRKPIGNCFRQIDR